MDTGSPQQQTPLCCWQRRLQGLRQVAFDAQWRVRPLNAAIDLARERRAKVASSTALWLTNEVKFQLRPQA
jgi:hypothetical protein